MDSKAHLALMAKARKVFESDDSFLAFPVTPLVYDRSELDFSMTGSADRIRAGRANIEAFSLLVNLIPEGNAWIPGESRFLWDEYGHVLRRGSCASSTRTPAEEAAYRAAREYLKDTDADGMEKDSPQLMLYRQYEDAWRSVREEFDEARFSDVGEFSDDAEVRERWKGVEEPAFRKRLDDLERQWTLEGHKIDVEERQDTLIALGARSPLSTWLEWKASFNPNLDSQTGAATQIEVFPTSFSPSNALDDGMWKRFELDRATIEALVAQAPAELKTRFGDASGGPDIESMSLEFSTAVLNRHWFERDVLHSRFWRLTDDSKVLSDGELPADGDCPAYVTGIVFARHVTVKEKSPAPVGEQPGGPSPSRPWHPLRLEFSPLVAGKSLVKRLDPALLQTIQPIRFEPALAAGPRAVRLPTAAVRPSVVASPAILPRPTSATLAARPSAVVTPIRADALPKRLLTLEPNRIALQRLAVQPTYERLDAALVKPVPGTGIRPVPPPPPPASDADEIQILAFICKSVPKCPDPDPSLTW